MIECAILWFIGPVGVPGGSWVDWSILGRLLEWGHCWGWVVGVVGLVFVEDVGYLSGDPVRFGIVG